MTVKERLEQYIKEDKIYQDFIDTKIRIKDLTDFDLFCIKHCSDIEEILEENKQLKEKVNKLEILIENLKLGVTLNQEQEDLLDKVLFGGDGNE
nr:MAG TPA: hypothetical protein [Crassvirales sp.]